MARKFAIAGVAFLAVASVSGIALGHFATKTATPTTNAAIDTDSRAEDAKYGPTQMPPTPTAATDMAAPNHIPVCRKGCGPRIGERHADAYFGESHAQLDTIYGTDYKDYLSDGTAIVSYAPKQKSAVARPTASIPVITSSTLAGASAP